MEDSSESLEEVLFELAIQKLNSAERSAFLDVVCQGNGALRARLDEMLEVHFRGGGFLAGLVDPDPPATMLPPEVASESPSPTIAGYKLLEKIGEGGFGDVWMAEQRTPIKRRVALKIVKPGMDSRQVIARFEAERQALALMDHPNIARIYDAGSNEAGRPYFVMELVRGSKITDYCDQNRLPTSDRLRLFMQVCHAVQHAHQKGIIHRDLKPSNILITLHDGVPVPKVIDFGIAKAMQQELTDKTLFTQFSQFIGTPAYISPEQAELSGLDVDTRADIYSLGVLLYELLVGRTPFDAKEMLQDGIDALRRTIREQEPTKPSTKLATLAAVDRTATAQRRQTDATRLTHLLRGDLDWIVMKCLEKDRARRYETANGLAMDIYRYLSHQPVSARRPSFAYQLQKAWQRNRLLATTLAAVALAMSVGLAISIWQAMVATEARQDERAQRLVARDAQTTAERERGRADEQARRAVENEQRARRLLYASDMNLAQRAVQLNHLGEACRLLDRHRPQTGDEDLRGWEWRYLWQLTRGNDRVTLAMRPSPGSSVSLSPDGTRLAVGWRDGQVDLWDVAARQQIRELTPRGSGQPGAVAFAPTGNVLVATSSRGVVTLYHFDSGLESILFRLPDAESLWISELAFSSDGSRLLVYARGGDLDRVWVVDVSAAAVISHHDGLSSGHGAWFGGARLSRDNSRLFLSRNDTLANRCSIQCVDLATGEEVWKTQSISDLGITALDLSPDGRLLASGNGFADSIIRIWDTSTGQLVIRLDGHTSWVSELAFTSDGGYLISASADSSILRWNTDSWSDPKPLRGHADEIHALSISESGQMVATAGKDGSLIVWRSQADDTSDGHRILPEDLDWGQILPVDHSRLMLLYPDRPPSLVDLQSTSPPRPLESIRSGADVLGWLAPDRLCHWSGANELFVSELNKFDITRRHTILLNSAQRPGGMTFHAGRQLLAWTEAATPTSIWLVNLSDPNRRIELKNDTPVLAPFLFSAEGDYLAGWCGGDWKLRVWELETGKIVTSVAGDVADAVFAGGGRVLVTAMLADEDHEFAFYDLRHPELTPRRMPGRFLPRELSMSPDGRLVAATTHDGRVRFFDPMEATVIDEVRGQFNGAFGVAFSPDGRRLASASVGREAIKLWDAQTRQELLTLASTATDGDMVVWTADGNAILAGSPCHVWRAPTWDEIAAAEAKEHASP